MNHKEKDTKNSMKLGEILKMLEVWVVKMVGTGNFSKEKLSKVLFIEKYDIGFRINNCVPCVSCFM